MEMEMEVDRISNLPWNIADKILSFLPLRDAARTSILSSKWRYNWANLTSLVFDFDTQSLIGSDYPSWMLADYKVAEMVKIVNHVLLLHNGPIHKFKLLKLGDHRIESDIDRWILFLSRRSVNVKEFILAVSFDGEMYELPSWLYLFDKLSRLELSSCWLKPSSAFNGFKNLTSLYLSEVQMDQDLLENLINMCPLLESLTLKEFYGLGHLKIHAPKLASFYFAGAFKDVNFENTVHLSTVTIYLFCYGSSFYCHEEDIGNDHESSLGTTSKLIKFFASLPSIQRLMVGWNILKILAADHMVPRRLPTPCMQLNYLSLGIQFSDMKQCVAALCILRSSPNLIELKIKTWGPPTLPAPRSVTKELMEEDYTNCFFNQLRFVEMTGGSGVPRELNFINTLLANSPILERMTIKPDYRDNIMELVKELLQFRRASAHAKIICNDLCF